MRDMAWLLFNIVPNLSRIAQLSGPFIQDQFHAAVATGAAATQQLDPHPAARRSGLRFDPPAYISPSRLVPYVAGTKQQAHAAAGLRRQLPAPK
jgi:hypothetical protein